MKLQTFFAALLIAASAKAQSDLNTLDLAAPREGAITRVHGSTGSGRAGVPVCGGYDCDGDGFKDYAFAQIQASPLGRTLAGEVTLVFGDGTIGATMDSAGLQAGMRKIAGDREREITGAEIWMGDVNGDGLGDLLIGRQNYTPAAGREGAGALTILFGHAGLRADSDSVAYLDLRNPPAGVPMVTIIGALAYDRLGIWMRTGDLTGDGLQDFAVSADQVDGPGENNRGAVYVFRGGPHISSVGASVDLANFGTAQFPAAWRANTALVRPPPGSGNYHFGSTLYVDDLDGNGRAELAASAALNRAGAGLQLAGTPSGASQPRGGSLDGSVFLCWDENFPPFPWPNGYSFNVMAPPHGGFTRIDGESANISFGEEILMGADYSGDGFLDLFVGDLVGQSSNGPFSGLGYVFHGAAGLRDRIVDLKNPPTDLAFTRIHGPSERAIGADTCDFGDFDQDGYEDLCFGSPDHHPQGRIGAGSVHILYGQPGGWPANINLAPGNMPPPSAMRILEIDGARGSVNATGDTGDMLCYSAASADMNGDGKTDLIVNEMSGNGFGGLPLDVGNVLLISGAAMLPKPSDPFTITGNHFGPRDIAAGPIQQSVKLSVPGGPMQIMSLALSGLQSADFVIVSDSGQTILGTGGTRTLLVEFDPSSVGPKSTAVVLAVSGLSGPIRMPLTGIGMRGDQEISLEFSACESDTRLLGSTQFGLSYLLWRSPDLTAASWSALSGPWQGTGGRLHMSDLNTNSVPRFFYQLRQFTP